MNPATQASPAGSAGRGKEPKNSNSLLAIRQGQACGAIDDRASWITANSARVESLEDHHVIGSSSVKRRTKMIALTSHRHWVVQDRVRERGAAWGAWQTLGQRIFTRAPDDPIIGEMRPATHTRCLLWARNAILNSTPDDPREAEYRLFDVKTRRTVSLDPRTGAMLSGRS